MLYVTTAVRNRFNITKEFVESLKKQTFKDFRLILVDDGSTDDTDKMIKEKLPESIILYGNGNLWWGGSLHKIYKYIKKNNLKKDDYILIVNDDIKFENNFLLNAIDILNKNPGIIISACGYSSKAKTHKDGAILYDFKTGVFKLLETNMEGNCASTRALFLKIDDFLKIGGFRPILLPHYASDYEWTIRASRKGYKIMSFENLKYEINEDTTGLHDYNNLKGINFILKVFSKKSGFNPIYRINFIILATPLKYLPINLLEQLKRYYRNLKKYLTKEKKCEN